MTLSVEIITPEQKLEPLEADHVTLPAFDGEFGVRNNHAPYVVLLGEGVLDIKSEQKANAQFALKGGVAQIQQNTIYVLAESVIETSDISESKLLERLRELDATSFDDAMEASRARAEANWIVTQLRSAGKDVPELQILDNTGK